MLAVIGEQPAFPRLLGDGQVTHAVRVITPLEIAEISGREKFVLVARPALELFAREDVLLVDGVAFAQGLREGGKKVRVLVVAVDVRAVFLHGILDFQDGGIFPVLGVQHAHALRLFHGEIDVLEDTFALAARAEGIDRYRHADAQGYKD
mgnify:FL=1